MFSLQKPKPKEKDMTAKNKIAQGVRAIEFEPLG
jgi:hypothetical protein